MQDTDSIVAQVGQAAERLFADVAGPGGRAAQQAMARGDWPQSVWARIVEAGLDGLLADDLDGEGWPAANAVLAAFGRHAIGAPLVETLVARGVLRHAGAEDAGSGPWSVVQLDEAASQRLERDSKGVVLVGGPIQAPWGRHATRVLVCGTCEGVPVAAVWSHPSQALVSADNTMAWEPLDTLDFGARSANECYTLPDGLVARELAALATACAMVGAAGRVLELSLTYANDRVQFGKNIGKFQAIQHALASLSCEVAAATMAVALACEAAESGAATGEVAVAKIRAGQAAETATAVGHQVHGAIGFTDEHSLHDLTRRLWAWRRAWGTERDWSLALGRQVLQGRGAGAWPLIVSLSSGATV